MGGVGWGVNRLQQKTLDGSSEELSSGSFDQSTMRSCGLAVAADHA